ncbi:glucose-6-phosphate isomerase [Variovorax sp. PCZ-1]|uniref:glucose-6-phosphate isomerase n=1 Tax=Variovorax sp. PCZ-1 TaxID=2835533 RepID=UPI001BD00193|nr:glucose-6-phosphate isomerase [Variovorax sp. PCZ-1]MBS7806213.1 glucose-6-phosphate isomerase [Variovorax sp. PCZ-1]
MTRCDQTTAWKKLGEHFNAQGKSFDARIAFALDAERVSTLSQTAPHIFADLSKNRIDAATEALLMQLARECGLEAQRDAMLTGEAINSTEGRAVLHTLLRQKLHIAGVGSAQSAINSGVNADKLQDVHSVLSAMLTYAETIRADDEITDVVNIGIGGSDLGPAMATIALDEFVTPKKRFHFVSNIDGHELAATLKTLKAKNTLFLIASKTFTTIETMTNAQSAKAWFTAQGGTDTARHFAALTTNVKAANEFGITTTFGFWDWVGGRYSLWSAIGLPLAIAIGADNFRQFLNGAAEMDAHFATAPLEKNLPVRLGLLDVWYRNFHGFTSRCVAPYHSALRRFPAYLQQLEMESNGKRVDKGGQALPFHTSPVVWGEPGTNGQHAFFQMLHQGTEVIPLEFIAVKRAAHSMLDHHTKLLANAIAQSQAFLQGKVSEDGHRHFPGNRPSSFFVLDELTPASLGALIALYEHRVFVSGAIWGINSFDQFGVELGKVLAKDVEARLHSGNVLSVDASTAALITKLK